MLEVAYFFTQSLVSDHLRARINVVDTIQPIESHRVTQKMVALECGVDAKNAVSSSSALNVVQKDGDDPYLSTQKLRQEILVKEYLVYPVLTCGFDGTNDFGWVYQFGLGGNYRFITRKDQI